MQLLCLFNKTTLLADGQETSALVLGSPQSFSDLALTALVCQDAFAAGPTIATKQR
jgi:hypothetical protein